MPPAWAGRLQWRLLATDADANLVFLQTWRDWKADPQRPAMLHVVLVAPGPQSFGALLALAEKRPDLASLMPALEARWPAHSAAARSGFQRVVLDGGQVLLTLCSGDLQAVLRQLHFDADAACCTPRDLGSIKALARLCRQGTVLRCSAATDAAQRKHLAECGFAISPDDAGSALFAPGWTLRRRPRHALQSPGTCVVVGAGLAGAAAASSLARRGWQVRVLDAGAAPAAGASGLPAGLLAAHESPDDNLLSQLTRAGMQMTLQQAQALLQAGEDWCASGVREDPGVGTPVRWQADAAWIKPAALVRAWLAQPGISFSGNLRVEGFERLPQGGWRLVDANGGVIANAQLVVLAAAHGSAALAPGLDLQPVRGQVSFGAHPPGAALPDTPVNGNGYFIPQLPLGGDIAWLCGSSFARGDSDLTARPLDDADNLERLRSLLPAVAQQLAPLFAARAVQSWAGIRCVCRDRRPLLGALAPDLWVSTAMGSRGLSFAVLCAELLAARLHGEPLPIPAKLAHALDVSRKNMP